MGGKGSHRSCEICGVRERHKHKSEALLFATFPQNEERCKEWLRVVGNDELVHLPIEKLAKKRYVCGNHFEKRDFNMKGNRLKKLAIPVLNLTTAPLTDEQLSAFPQHMWKDTEASLSEEISSTLPVPIEEETAEGYWQGPEEVVSIRKQDPNYTLVKLKNSERIAKKSNNDLKHVSRVGIKKRKQEENIDTYKQHSIQLHNKGTPSDSFKNMNYMALCINCNRWIPTSQQYVYNATNMNPDIVSIIEDWTAREVTDNDRICQECVNLLLIEASCRNEPNKGVQQDDHTSTCCSCGISIDTRTSSQKSHKNHPEHAYLEKNIEAHQFPDKPHVCNACWQISHTQKLSNPAAMAKADNKPGSGFSSPDEPASPPISEPDCDTQDHNENKTININGYSRTLDSSNCCFIPECANLELLTVPFYLKKKILMDHKLYITPNARLCKEHAGFDNLGLLNVVRITSDFSVTYIIQMLDLLRKQ